jgi:hypothetical protein
VSARSTVPVTAHGKSATPRYTQDKFATLLEDSKNSSSTFFTQGFLNPAANAMTDRQACKLFAVDEHYALAQLVRCLMLAARRLKR